ncbi:MAG TPA: AAA family ATPase [Solirubrobacterales bacterium]|nr:AAA family ATPase [Solirubrobacterales bacterium]
METVIGPKVDVARITAITDDGLRIYLQYRNGQTADVTREVPFEWEVGDVLVVRAEKNFVELAPPAVWPEDAWVGIVRLKDDEVSVVEVGGRLHVLESGEVAHRVGNTVEGRDPDGILRVLSDTPVRQLDLPDVDDAEIERFKRPPAKRKLSFEDFGGLAPVVERALELIELPLKYRAALAKIGAKPIKGVLFTGLPGTGKTMLARIIAAEAGASFWEISGPEVFSKWQGQSEEVLRKIFARASEEERSIIFFDEIDSVAAQRAEDANEASRRVVTQLLTLMDGFSVDDNVVVVATTNRPQDIDVALRRPGRFDWEINFPLPGPEDRVEILSVSARHLKTHGPLPHLRIAAETEGWSAAELAAIWSEAALLAVADGGREAILAEDYVGGHARVAAQRQRVKAEERLG